MNTSKRLLMQEIPGWCERENRVTGERMQPDKISWGTMLKSMSKPKKRQQEKLLLLHPCVRQRLRLLFFPKSLVIAVCLLACEG